MDLQPVKAHSLLLTAALSERMCQVARTAKHSFITARLEQIGAYHEQLASMVGEIQATQLIIELAEQEQEDSSPR